MCSAFMTTIPAPRTPEVKQWSRPSRNPLRSDTPKQFGAKDQTPPPLAIRCCPTSPRSGGVVAPAQVPPKFGMARDRLHGISALSVRLPPSTRERSTTRISTSRPFTRTCSPNGARRSRRSWTTSPPPGWRSGCWCRRSASSAAASRRTPRAAPTTAPPGPVFLAGPGVRAGLAGTASPPQATLARLFRPVRPRQPARKPRWPRATPAVSRGRRRAADAHPAAQSSCAPVRVAPVGQAIRGEAARLQLQRGAAGAGVEGAPDTCSSYSRLTRDCLPCNLLSGLNL
jgi:hypothetical protein